MLATTTGTVNPSLGATVITTLNGQTLTGTIFSAQGVATSTANGSAAAQSGGLAAHERVRVFAAMIVALLAAVCVL